MEETADKGTEVLLYKHSKTEEGDEVPKRLKYILVFFGMSALLPNAAILTDMDYFINRLPNHHPEFVYYMTQNFAMVVGQTAGV